jgi:hypothetical protein
MLQTKLVNRDDIALFKQISKTVVDAKLNDVIIQTQIDDIRPLLGESLFNDLMNDVSSYSDLMDGGTYTYNGITYTNYGLKAVISYYVYARYMMFGAVIDTPFGLVEKLNNQDSKPVDYSIKKSLYQTNRQSAFNIWLTVRDYLIRTNNPLFNNLCTIHKNNFKIRKIE